MSDHYTEGAPSLSALLVCGCANRLFTEVAGSLVFSEDYPTTGQILMRHRKVRRYHVSPRERGRAYADDQTTPPSGRAVEASEHPSTSWWCGGAFSGCDRHETPF